MKIAHIDFSGPYTEGMTYQENLLPDAMAVDGHDVYMFVPCYEWKDGVIVKTPHIKKRLKSGVKLQRFGFLEVCGNDYISRKIRIVPRFYKVLDKLKPDIIVLHCPQTAVSFDIARYIKNNKNTKLVIDTHTDYNNSARGFISRYILHRIIYRMMVRSAEKQSQIVYFISKETKEFYLKEYKGNKTKLKFLPLGGTVPSEEEYLSDRKKIRNELGIDDNVVLFLHSGKLCKGKKTDTLVEGFLKAGCEECILIIIGTCDEEIKGTIDRVNRDPNDRKRIKYLGWKSGDELMRYLIAADVYCQPGTQSATFQNAICHRCAVMSYPHKSYKEDYVDGNGVWVSNCEQIKEAVRFFAENRDDLKQMQTRSEEIAKEKLDYMSQGRMIIRDCKQ